MALAYYLKGGAYYCRWYAAACTTQEGVQNYTKDDDIGFRLIRRI